MEDQKTVYSVEEKIDYFVSRIKELAKEDEENIRKGIEEEKANRLNTALAAIDSDIQKYIREEKENEAAKAKVLLSRLLLEQKHLVAAERDRIKEELSNELLARAEKFTESPEYIDFLKSLTVKAYRETGATELGLCSRDMKFNEKIKTYFEIETTKILFVHEDGSVGLGGIRMYNRESGIMVNETLLERVRRIIGELPLSDILEV